MVPSYCFFLDSGRSSSIQSCLPCELFMEQTQVQALGFWKTQAALKSCNPLFFLLFFFSPRNLPDIKDFTSHVVYPLGCGVPLSVLTSRGESSGAPPPQWLWPLAVMRLDVWTQSLNVAQDARTKKKERKGKRLQYLILHTHTHTEWTLRINLYKQRFRLCKTKIKSANKFCQQLLELSCYTAMCIFRLWCVLYVIIVGSLPF